MNESAHVAATSSQVAKAGRPQPTYANLLWFVLPLLALILVISAVKVWRHP